MTKEPVKAMVVRIPRDAKAWIEKQARRNGSSQNSEIVRCVRDRMEAKARNKAA